MTKSMDEIGWLLGKWNQNQEKKEKDDKIKDKVN